MPTNPFASFNYTPQYPIPHQPVTLNAACYAVGLYNRSSQPRRIGFTWNELGLPSDTELHLRDLWKHGDLGVYQDSYAQEVEPDDCVVIRLKETLA